MKTLHHIRTLKLLMVKKWGKYYSDLFSNINKRNQTTPQKMKSSLDYDVFYSRDTVDFLDCTVRIRNREFKTELYTKDTDAHLYLLSSSCHPKHTIKAIPKGQLKGLDANMFEHHRSLLETRKQVYRFLH